MGENDQDDISTQVMSTQVSFSEVIHWINRLKVDSGLVRSVHRQKHFWSQCCCRRRKSCVAENFDNKLSEEKGRVLLLTLTKFDFQDSMHCRILQTIYSNLTTNL